MSVINKKQAFNHLKKSLDNFNFEQKAENCSNEAQTKKFLIDPFFMLLNYAHEDLIPEYEADFGERVSNKVDYAIKLGRKDIIIVECKKLTSKLTDKEAGQLSGYFQNAKNSRIAILTNGKEYRFYSDVALINTMDSKPFFVFNLDNYTDNDIESLLDFDARVINVNEIILKAQESVFIEDFELTFLKEMIGPSSDFLKLLHKKMTFKSKFNEEKMKELMNSSLFKSLTEKIILHETKTNSKSAGIITTEEELQAYHTIRTLLIQNKKIPNLRIGYRDQKGTFNILVDDNQKKMVCQLKFSDANKKVFIGNNEYQISHLDELLNYKSELIERTLSLID
ncbi:MAG TPA: type I restriction enzyme HsdR N-terminal domain-containing protein [Flavobacterium sp.]|uniref:type I restriction enzyme HsdR N-terminal domain-containing protein n=1 Tax=Flavobacterium sp. TaxID=239 RepID=UPI002BC976B9|nr:type I restriction enzyme HsdR N-terminal domain-containing protein [Flavobacterium sp.]HSD15585.1 type I restriction enzyme HsdR N-terminal domain-containing protein [Flavobacterium sp.]